MITKKKKKVKRCRIELFKRRKKGDKIIFIRL